MYIGKTYHWCYYCMKGGKEYPESCKRDHWFCAEQCKECPPCPKCNKNVKKVSYTLWYMHVCSYM